MTHFIDDHFQGMDENALGPVGERLADAIVHARRVAAQELADGNFPAPPVALAPGQSP